MSVTVVVRYKGPSRGGAGATFIAKWQGKQRSFPYNYALGVEANYQKAVERAVGDCTLVELIRTGESSRTFLAYPREASQEGIERLVSLSTGHMPSTKPEWGDLRVVEHEYGYVVFVNEQAEAPEWCQPIMEWALAMEATLVLFDNAAPTLARFRRWEW